MALKKANPDFPILIRECSGVQPKLWARYGKQGVPAGKRHLRTLGRGSAGAGGGINGARGARWASLQRSALPLCALAGGRRGTCASGGVLPARGCDFPPP